MITALSLVHALWQKHIGFYAGVPDSTLKSLCALLAYISAQPRSSDASEELQDLGVKYTIAANEGNAVALCAGHYLATGQAGCVFMQNSGLGNCVNPLTSLTDPDVYSIPMMLIIGWRGAPQVHDEPQHAKQGRITLSMLDTLEIPFEVISEADNDDSLFSKLSSLVQIMWQDLKTVALVIRPKSFAPLPPNVDSFVAAQFNGYVLYKYEAIAKLASLCSQMHGQGKAVKIFASTGHIARELFQVRAHQQQTHCNDFYCVGSMGHVSSIALGYSMAHPQQQVFVFDGDGACLMHLGALYVIGAQDLPHFHHIVFDNAAHDSVGGQQISSEKVNYEAVARALGYTQTCTVRTITELEAAFESFSASGPSLMVVKVSKGAPSDLMRPDLTPVQMKQLFMQDEQ